MTRSIDRRLELHSSDPGRSEELRTFLRQKYGIYGIRLVELEDEINDKIELRYGDARLLQDDIQPQQLAEFVTEAMVLDVDQLSCRDDAAMLDRYRNPDNTLNIYEDPRDWIKSNPMIAELILAQQSMSNVIDFLCEQRGLFLKPPQYKLQGTYWNSTSNGGLPIVRKKDPIHEGTFMLHDLFHMVIQDPLPFARDSEPGDPTSRGNFLSHRMASEAMTMVLADMHAVHTAGLDEKGYDTTKRRIYPVYKEILAEQGSISIYDVVSANIDFCFTGETDTLASLGATEETIESFTEKYDTFFSADYDWNDHNYVACNKNILQNPSVAEYYSLAESIYGLPMIDDIYQGRVDKDQIICSFVEQLNEAQNYTAHNNEAKRMKEIARRFYGGQLALFYDNGLSELEGSYKHKEYIRLSKALMEADTVEDIQIISAMLNELVRDSVDITLKNGHIDAQTAALYQMHVPLYPAFFINYQQERERIVPLQRKIALINQRLT